MAGMGHPTQEDIARLAGVSRTTVSYVLSDRQDERVRISQATRERVKAIAAQLGYQPNAIARSLRLQRTQTLALVIPDIANPFYPALTRGFQDGVAAEQYQTFIINTDNIAAQEERALSSIIHQRVDGAVLVVFHLAEEHIERLVRAGIAVVVLGFWIHHPAVDRLFSNDRGGAYKAVRYLVERGHRRIAHIAGPLDTPPARSRCEGYRQALVDSGIPVDEALICEGDFTRGSGRACLRRLMALPDRPTALFAANDIMAIDAMLEAQSMGLRIPDDLAVIGLDDIPEASLIRPSLTTIPQRPYQMGRRAAEMLLDRLRHPRDEFPARSEVIELELVVRESA